MNTTLPGQTTPAQADVLSLITTDREDTLWPFEIVDPPEPEEDPVEFPEPDEDEGQFEDPEAIVQRFASENSFNGGNGKSKATAANDKQISTIKSLLKNPKVNPDEKQRITKLLAGDLEKQTACDMLDYFLGRSEKQNGQWVKVSEGVLAERS